MLATAQHVKRLHCKCCGVITKHETGFYDDPKPICFMLTCFSCGLLFPLFLASLFAKREFVCAICGTKTRV